MTRVVPALAALRAPWHFLRCAIAIVALTLLSENASAIPLYEVPGLQQVQVGYIGFFTINGGVTQEKLASAPDSYHEFPLKNHLEPEIEVLGGTTDEIGNASAGDEYFTLAISGNYSGGFDFVRLVLDPSWPERFVYPTAIVLTNNLVFAGGDTLADLERALQGQDGDTVHIVEGSIVLAFPSTVPEPGTALLVSLGLVGLARRRSGA